MFIWATIVIFCLLLLVLVLKSIGDIRQIIFLYIGVRIGLVSIMDGVFTGFGAVGVYFMGTWFSLVGGAISIDILSFLRLLLFHTMRFVKW